MLPDCLTPYKHYNEETISGVLDGIVNSDDEDSEMYPSEKTMLRLQITLKRNASSATAELLFHF